MYAVRYIAAGAVRSLDCVMLPEQIALVSEESLPPRCPYCGSSVTGGGLCFSHVNPDLDWAASNRAMCDFVHRGQIRESPRGEELRSEELLA